MVSSIKGLLIMSCRFFDCEHTLHATFTLGVLYHKVSLLLFNQHQLDDKLLTNLH